MNMLFLIRKQCITCFCTLLMSVDIYVMMSSYVSETWSSARAEGHCFWLVQDTWSLWAVTRTTEHCKWRTNIIFQSCDWNSFIWTESCTVNLPSWYVRPCGLYGFVLDWRFEKDLLAWVRIQLVLQNNCLKFHKMNNCHQVLLPVVVIQLFPNVYLNNGLLSICDML